jgi:type IV pilus assembly protein PilZ
MNACQQAKSAKQQSLKQEGRKEIQIHCPYCTKEITRDEIQCPTCGTTYGLETLLLVKSAAKEVMRGLPHRKYDRVPKKYAITYTTPKTLVKNYLSNIGRGGVFIPTKKPLDRREKVTLKIFLPDGGEAVEVFGEVAWSRRVGKETPQGTYPQGMGVKFLNLAHEAKERIFRILRQRTVRDTQAMSLSH